MWTSGSWTVKSRTLKYDFCVITSKWCSELCSKEKNISEVDSNSGFWGRTNILGNWFSCPIIEMKKFRQLKWPLWSLLCESIGITGETLESEQKLTNLTGIFLVLTCFHFQYMICILWSVWPHAAIPLLDLKIFYNDDNYIFFCDQKNNFLKTS